MTDFPRFLTLQSTYEKVEIALFVGHTSTHAVHINKKESTETLIPHLQSLINEAQCNLEDLSFIAANTGPAPFTTLRVVIATINGISFASKIPLIGIDGLWALLDQYRQPQTLTIALLDAFNNEVYYAIEQDSEPPLSGYSSIDSLIKTLSLYRDCNLQFIGNGAHLYYDTLTEYFADAVVHKNIPFCSLDSVAQIAFNKWRHKKPTNTILLPHYLKSI
jgi:tRNA threonylcarbamoyladenosine biosynthesis protein TsaB